MRVGCYKGFWRQFAEFAKRSTLISCSEDRSWVFRYLERDLRPFESAATSIRISHETVDCRCRYPQ